MANQTKKEYCEDFRSRIEDLFESPDDMVDRKMGLTIYGEKYTFEKLQSAMLDQPPFIEHKELSPRVDLNSIRKKDVECFNKTVDQCLPRVKEPCLMQWVCAKKFKEVAFYDSEVRNGKLLPPRMTIDVGTVAANSSVRINTGYIFKIPSKANILNLKNGEIVETGYNKQPHFVILPQIICDDEGFIPTVYARDPEDTGLFTVNFSTQSGEVGKLRVIFKAYRVVSPRNQVGVINTEQSSSTVFKPKDQNVGRLVSNLKPKVVFESMSYEKDGDKVLFKTYDSTQMKPKLFEKQKLCVERLSMLIVSRKREWYNNKLVTLSGMFVPSQLAKGKDDNCLAPKIAQGSEYTANTHCVTFVDSRLNLFSAEISDISDSKIVNGAFCNSDSYAEVSKRMRKVILALNGLSVGAKHCLAIASRRPDLPFNQLIKLMDYHKSVIECDDQLKEKCQKNDKGMYESKPSHAEAYSLTLYKAFRFLIGVYFASNFTANQIEELKLSMKGVDAVIEPISDTLQSEVVGCLENYEKCDVNTIESTDVGVDIPRNSTDEDITENTDYDATAEITTKNEKPHMDLMCYEQIDIEEDVVFGDTLDSETLSTVDNGVTERSIDPSSDIENPVTDDAASKMKRKTDEELTCELTETSEKKFKSD